MNSSKSNKGFALLGYLLIVAVIAVGAMVIKPKFLDGDSKRADKSVEASAKVEDATAKLLEAEKAKGAHAAASVAQIGVAAADAPASPATDFIKREVPVAAASLPPPDPKALLEATERRLAIMEGRLDDARALYAKEATEAARLRKEGEEAKVALASEQAARREVDGKLVTAAAVNLALERQQNAAIVVIVLLVGAFIWFKYHSIGIPEIAKIGADIRQGVDPITALSTYVPHRLFDKIQRAVKQQMPLQPPPTKSS